MPRQARVLTDREVRAIRKLGLHSVGAMVPGLALQVTQTLGHPLTRSWVLRAVLDGRRRALGLGPYPAVTLAQAREKAAQLHFELRDPQTLQSLSTVIRPRRFSKAPVAPPTMTFEVAALQFIEERRASWKNQKHALQWESTLKNYVYPVIGQVPVREVDKLMVLKIIKPMWNEKTETADRVRDRIKLVLNWAKAHGLREGDNPADWRGHLEHVLAPRHKVAKLTHQPAVPVAEMAAFMHRLRTEQTEVAAKALEFAILTAARDGEVRGATWDEIDLDAGVWQVPAERMKAGKAHRVPLSPTAINLLKALPKVMGVDRVFPGESRHHGGLSENTLNMVIKRLHARQPVSSDVKGRPAVVHGMRSTFRNWGRTLTDFRSELLELSLAHAVGNAAEQAYARDDALEQRRAVMVAWAAFLKSSEARCPIEVSPSSQNPSAPEA
jgi:integrase